MTTNQIEYMPLSEYLWNNSLSIANAAMETEFLHGIRHGSLHPKKYGAYCVQDLAYCRSVVKDYEHAMERAEMPETIAFLKARIDSNKEYFESSKKQWHLDNTDALVCNQAVENYINLERQIATCMDPVYLVVAMIPCLRLWNWLANQMLAYEGSTNVYSFWIRENRQGDGGKKLEKFVNSNVTNLDKDTALLIYQATMICESNFFRSACNQVLDPLPEGLEEVLEAAQNG